MNLLRITPSELGEVLEGKDPQRRDWLLTGLDEGRAKRLLQAFVDGRWRAHADSVMAGEVLSR